MPAALWSLGRVRFRVSGYLGNLRIPTNLSEGAFARDFRFMLCDRCIFVAGVTRPRFTSKYRRKSNTKRSIAVAFYRSVMNFATNTVKMSFLRPKIGSAHVHDRFQMVGKSPRVAEPATGATLSDEIHVELLQIETISMTACLVSSNGCFVQNSFYPSQK